MTLPELQELLTAEAVQGRLHLTRAERARNERRIGYWTAYVEDRERMVVILAEMVDEREE